MRHKIWPFPQECLFDDYFQVNFSTPLWHEMLLAINNPGPFMVSTVLQEVLSKTSYATPKASLQIIQPQYMTCSRQLKVKKWRKHLNNLINEMLKITL
jgi:hypothetical protein